jgi:hypothetical protein
MFSGARMPFAVNGVQTFLILYVLWKKCHGLSTNPAITDILLGGMESWLNQRPWAVSDYAGDYAE